MTVQNNRQPLCRFEEPPNGLSRFKQTRGTEWMVAEELPKVERIEQAGLF
jgi:hypothetical protein